MWVCAACEARGRARHRGHKAGLAAPASAPAPRGGREGGGRRPWWEVFAEPLPAPCLPQRGGSPLPGGPRLRTHGDVVGCSGPHSGIQRARKGVRPPAVRGPSGRRA